MSDRENRWSAKDAGREMNKAVREGGKTGDTHLLQIAVVLLAVVSFFTTANGMSEYIFSGNKAIAYAASAAIQGILLALSMNLPEYLRGIWEKGSSRRETDGPEDGGLKNPDRTGTARVKRNRITLGKIALVFFTILLTCTAIFCSSWFSYIYIAEVIHDSSWGSDSELLVQQSYRSELYDAQEYARIYRAYLEQTLGEKILDIEEQAGKLDNNMVEFGLNWDEEAATYVTNGGTAAAGYMAPVINAMRNAAPLEAPQESRDLAARALEDAEQNISARMISVQDNLNNLDARITMYNNQIATLTARIRNAEEGTDTTALTNAINNYTQLIGDATQQQTDLQLEYTQLNNAYLRLPIYRSFLGLNSSTSSISIRSELMQMQEEFFQPDPDEERLLKIANDIFSNLRSGASMTADGSGDSLSYTELLVQMNRLVQDLTDYSDIKKIETTLGDLVTELRTSGLAGDPEAGGAQTEPGADTDPAGPLEPTDSPGPSGPVEPTDPLDSPEPVEPSESPEPSASAGPTSSPEPSESVEPTNPPENDTQGGSGQGGIDWRDRIERLKAQIGAMPTYSGSGEDGSLTSSQLSVLRGYDRDESGKRLDDITRRYIFEHNAIYQGIIYLQSPYRSLAIFALVLALSFDLAGFVFGVVISGRTQAKSSAPAGHDGGSAASNFAAGPYSPTEWSVLEPQNHYKVLTGDYERRDEYYYYHVFYNGVLEEWRVQAEEAGAVYGRGIYNTDILIQPEARLAVEKEHELLFAGQEKGPADGVFKNCRLWFKDGSLMREVAEEQKAGPEDKPRTVKRSVFVAAIDEYVPFHIYSPGRGENRTVPALELREGKAVDVDTAVIALSKNGTRVVAVYIIEK